jgi:hypothetical protein
MSSGEHVTPSPDPGRPGGNTGISALPPVAPPSGKLMLQLFLVPGLIVAFLVLAWLVGGWLFGVSYSKEKFLTDLKNENAEVRWRTAENLAQVLLRDDALASDGDFARQLAVLEAKTHDAARPAEKAYVEFLANLAKEEPDEAKRKEKADAERRKLEADRNVVTFLGAALGDFMVPVGAPVLKELASQKEGRDPRGLALQRRQAVWALANLGENLKRFDKLSDKEKGAVLDRMRVAVWDAAQPGGGREDFLKLSADEKDEALDKLDVRAGQDHADWLRDALRVLRKRFKGENDDMGVGDALIECSRDRDDAYLRELSAFAMNFWRGDDAANARMQEALARLVNDGGEGESNLAELWTDKDETPTEAVSKIPGLLIRFNAAVALARFGSKDARLDVLKDMLDENYLRANLVLRPRNGGGPEQPNDEVIGQTLLNALKAVAELHRLRPDVDLSSLKPGVDALAGSGNPEVRTEAEKTRLALQQ